MSNTTTIEIDDEVLNQRGRKYKAVAFRRPKSGELAVGADGVVRRVEYRAQDDDPRLIVEEITPLLMTDGKQFIALAKSENEATGFNVRYGWRRVTDDEMTSLGGALELLQKFRAESK